MSALLFGREHQDILDPMTQWDFRELDSLLGGANGFALGRGDPFGLGGLGNGLAGKGLPSKFKTAVGVMDSLIPGADAPPLEGGPEGNERLGGGGILDTDLYLAHVLAYT